MHHRRQLSIRRFSEHGVSKLTLLIFGALLLSVGYVVYEALPKYYRFYELQNQAAGMAERSGIITDKEIRRRLTREIKRNGIPVDPEDIELIRGENEMEINLSYEDTLWFPWFNNEDIEIYTIPFDLHVHETFTGRRQKY